MVLSLAMSEPNLIIGIWDVCRAHLHPEVRRHIVVRLPRDMGQDQRNPGRFQPGQLMKPMRC